MLFGARLYDYKARVYDPAYGHFLQTDPIGSKDDLDLYAYTADDRSMGQIRVAIKPYLNIHILPLQPCQQQTQTGLRPLTWQPMAWLRLATVCWGANVARKRIFLVKALK
ncbi:MAG: RHS repeat-associated core domain-containing protein [Asticcacaulis sp.]